MTITKIFDVAGKVAAVTGGASGIGLAMVEGLAENGATVTIMDLNAEALDTEVARLQKLGYAVDGELVDVTNRENVRNAFDNVAAKHGKLDITFANAGVDPGAAFMNPDGTRNPAGEIDRLDDAIWDRSIDIMLTGAFNTVKAAAKHMKTNNDGAGSGSIVVTTSVAVHVVGGLCSTPYMPAKAGAAHFVRQAAIDLALYNIRVNSIAPGPFMTNINNGMSKTPEAQEAFKLIIPLGSMAHPDKMKGLALFLASDASGYVTGAEVIIDGGLHLGAAG